MLAFGAVEQDRGQGSGRGPVAIGVVVVCAWGDSSGGRSPLSASPEGFPATFATLGYVAHEGGSRKHRFREMMRMIEALAQEIDEPYIWAGVSLSQAVEA
jgi:hypothetical protein